MGEKNRVSAAVYLDGQSVELDMVKMPEIRVGMKVAAKLACSLSDAWQSIVFSFEVITNGFSKWIQLVAAEVDAAHEQETELHRVSIDNRPMYIRYHHTKKKRIRTKYVKRILMRYRTEALDIIPLSEKQYTAIYADFAIRAPQRERRL